MGFRYAVIALAWCAAPAFSQAPCASTAAYSPCDMVFELNDQEAAMHPNPYDSVQLHVEFRSARFRTFRMPGFWDGGRRMLVRFSPTEGGNWTYRASSNIARWEGQPGTFMAAESPAPGFIKPANMHHWAYTGENAIGGNIPHLWMGDTCYRFALLDEALFRTIIDARAAQKFNHLRGLVLGSEENTAKVFATRDQPDPAWFQRLDARIRYMNSKGMVADLILAGDENHLAKLFPEWQQRERYIRYLVARYAPMNVTWQGVQEFEEYENGRELTKEIGRLLKQLDPYQHPRSTHTLATSAPLLDDGWMDYVSYQSSDDRLGAIEHQIFAVPFVNLEFGYEDSGAGKSHPHHVDTDTFRRRLWNATMDGQYVTFGNTGTYGGRKFRVDAKYLDSPGAKQMTVWYEFFSGTRHWELEPYFDVDGGRALALEGVEYIIYVEKPGPVEVLLERHGYDVAWINPITGERTKMKDFKGQRFTGEPPDKAHDWVLHISREGHKEGMLRSYKFESRRLGLQEIDQNPQRVPFEIEQPAGEAISLSKPGPFAARIKRETRATRSMMWLWTGDVVADAQGFRVLGTGQRGTLRIPAGVVRHFPAVLSLRLYGMNANGKVYALDKPYQLTQ